MPNAVLDRLLAQRDEQLAFVDQLMERVAADERDLVEAERSNLDAARQRVTDLDAQIGPLQEFESMRHTAAETQARALGRADAPRAVPAGTPEGAAYRTAGEYLVDHLRARGGMRDRSGRVLSADADAAGRLTRAAQNQTTADTPGLLPEPVVGQVMNDIDASRPLMTSLGVRAMAGIPGIRFQRPKITQHVTVGKQVGGEKTQLPTQKMVIGSVEFTKDTYGGTVDISRQDIDWTDPSAWNILLTDLENVYARQTNAAVAAAFALGITQVEQAASTGLADVVTALYGAAAKAYQGCGQMVDRVWASLDMWALLGAMVDPARLLAPPAGQTGATAGTSGLSTFSGAVLDLPRVVDPALPAETLIVGWSGGFEVYEERIGLLTAVEPSILGVEVAYGGYLAAGFMNAGAFAKVDVTPVP